MAQHNDLGRQGEDEAALYLSQRGYRLLDRNWRFAHEEIDLVCQYYGLLVIVEVKTRSTDQGRYRPLDAVDRQKQRLLCEAAEAYRAYHQLRHLPLRFDVVTVVGREAPFQIRHYADAFQTPDAYPPSPQSL